MFCKHFKFADNFGSKTCYTYEYGIRHQLWQPQLCALGRISFKETQTKAWEAIFHSENVISIRNIFLHGQVYLHNLRHLEITS